MESSINVYLSEELIHEILLRLPVHALLRFKCVCKEWCALIRSRSFIDDHFSHESNHCLLIQRCGGTIESENEFTMYGDDGSRLPSKVCSYLSQMLTGTKSCDLLGPANGILCVVRPDLEVVLLNPATRELKPLPPIPLSNWRHLEYGFGFDPFSGDYKVVALERRHWNFQRYFCVYSSSSDSWRKAEVVVPFNERIYTIYGGVYGDAFLNGVSHWINWDDFRGCKSILGFDIRSENFQEIPVPDAIRDKRLVVDVTTYGGDSIALLSCQKENVDLWVMGRDGLWSQCFSIALPQPNLFLPCVWNKLLLQTITLTSCMFDISKQKVMKFESEFNVSIYGLLSYKESLVSIEGSERDGVDCIQAGFFD